MPLLLQKNITASTTIAVWEIEEDEAFFLRSVQLQQVIHHPHKRLQHLAGRYLLYLLCPGFPFGEMKINEARKPYLPSGDYHFSISHCGSYAAVILSTESGCGIDIELFSPKTETVKDKYLSEEEQAHLRSLRSQYEVLFHRHELYTVSWCAKEAVYKWWGNGRLDFKKNMVIQFISPGEETIQLAFAKDDIAAKLVLRFCLLREASLVWLVG